MIVPVFGLLIFLVIICLTISIPLISSPCNPAERRIVGPLNLDRSTIIGTFNLVMVCKVAISILIVLLSPGKTVSLKIVMLLCSKVLIISLKR